MPTPLRYDKKSPILKVSDFNTGVTRERLIKHSRCRAQHLQHTSSHRVRAQMLHYQLVMPPFSHPLIQPSTERVEFAKQLSSFFSFKTIDTINVKLLALEQKSHWSDTGAAKSPVIIIQTPDIRLMLTGNGSGPSCMTKPSMI